MSLLLLCSCLCSCREVHQGLMLRHVFGFALSATEDRGLYIVQTGVSI